MSICDSIKRKYIRLSKGQRKVAQYVIDHPAVVASHVAVEVGRLAGVSESTVIRFCYAMDLAGFSDLQEKMKEYLQQSGTPIPAPVANKKQISSKHTNLQQASQSIHSLGQSLNVEQLEQCATLLADSKEVHIVSFVQSTPVAAWLYEKLRAYRQNVHHHRYSNVLTNETIIHVEEKATLLLFIENEQQQAVQQILNDLKDSAIQVIAITNDKQWEKHYNYAQFILLKNANEQSDVTKIVLLETILQQLKANVSSTDEGQSENLLVTV